MARNTELDANVLSQLNKIFNEKKWKRELELGGDLYEKFCEMLKCLSTVEREMIMSLTEDYLWVDVSVYLKTFIKAFDCFIDNMTTERVYVLPLITEQESLCRTKSAQCLFYMVSRQRSEFLDRYKPKKIIFSDDISLKKIPEEKLSNSDVCLIDDFVGSGTTARTVVKEFCNRGVASNRISIVSIVMLESGFKLLREEENVHPYFCYSQKKGLSDYPERSKYISVMESLETRMKVREEERFGYARSEALVSMIDTPNNTFPIYWKHNNSFISPVPFPRR